MKQQLVSDEMYNVELLSVLCAIAGVYVVRNDYKHMISLVKKMNEILSVTMLQVYKPGISVFEAKCYLYFENDKNKAKELYHSATILAEQFDDKVFDKKHLLTFRKIGLFLKVISQWQKSSKPLTLKGFLVVYRPQIELK